MAERRCTADEAFGILVETSQQTNRKLRDVAEALVQSAGPDPSSASGRGAPHSP